MNDLQFQVEVILQGMRRHPLVFHSNWLSAEWVSWFTGMSYDEADAAINLMLRLGILIIPDSDIQQ